MKGSVSTLVPLFLRTRSFRLAMLPLLVAAALGWTSYLSLESRHLSPEQQVVSVLGGSDGETTMAAPVPPGRSPADTGRLFDGVEVDAVRLLASLEVQTTAGSKGLSYYEQPLPNPSVAGDLELASGRWPTRPGEVAVSEATELRVGSELRPVHGELKLTVVGVVSSVWASSQEVVHGAPGTWRTWQISPAAVERAGITSYREVYWSSPDPAAAASRLDREVETGGLDPSYTAEEIRAKASSFSAKAWMERRLPAVLAVWLGALMTGALMLRALRRTTVPLRRVGLPTRDLHRAAVLAALCAATAVLAGAWLGSLAATAAMRRFLLAGDRPLPPFQWWGSPIGVGVLTGLAVVGLLTALPTGARPRPASRRALPPRVMAVAGAVLCVLAIVGAFQGRGYTAILLTMLASCLGTALIAGAAMSLLPSHGAVGPGLLARRLVNRQAGGLTGLVVVVALLSSIVGSTFAVAAGLTAHLNASSSTGMPPGLVAFKGTAPGQPPDGELHAQFQQDMGLGDPVVVWYADQPTEDGDYESWWAVRDVADAEAIFGELTGEQEHALASPRGLPLTTEPGGTETALVVHEDLKYLQSLRRGEPGRPARVDTLWVHSGLTPAQDRQAARWAEENSVNPVMVWPTSVTDPIPISMGVQLSATAFTLLALLVCAVGMRGLVRSLVPLLAGLKASGLGARWLRSAVLQVSLLVGSMATLGGLAGILLSLFTINPLVNNTIVVGSLPWVALALVAVGGLLGSLLGGAAASWRVRAGERRA